MTNTSHLTANLSSEQKRALLAELLEKKAKAFQTAPLSFAQQRLWFLDRLQPDSSFYNMPVAARLEGDLNGAALEQSLNQIVSRHACLRTTFALVDEQPVQAIAPTLTLTLPIVDLAALSESEREAEALRLATAEAQCPFDLTKGPLLRASLLRLGGTSYVLLLTMHHIISDNWSKGILIKEISALYRACCTNQPSLLPNLPIQYADYARWQRRWLQGEVLETQLAYWKQQLAGAPPVLELPVERARTAIQTFRGATQSLLLPSSLCTALKTLSQQQGVTLFMTLLSAFKALLYRYTGQEDILVGTPIANRDREEIKGLIGIFVNTLVMRTSLRGYPSFRDLLHRVREVALEAYAHQDLPFEKLVEELQPERDLSHNPLFQVMFVLQNASMPAMELPGLTFSPIEVEGDTAKFDWWVSLAEEAEGLNIRWEYNTDLFDAITINRILGHFQTLLEAIVADPDQKIADLQLLRAAEREQLLEEWNRTGKDYPQDVCLHELFENQAERSPNSVALVFENRQLTYLELNQSANQLAHYLRQVGVKPGELVGICVERSLEMVVGLLGILKAGAAYVPLDPSYPQERLVLMLEDAQVAVLLTQERLAAPFSELATNIICLDRTAKAIAPEGTANLKTEVTADYLAYVIYTSGSTGKPKGVMVSHRQVVNFFTGMDDHIGGNSPGTWLAVTSICFDISILELFWTLARGFKVVVQGEQKAAFGKAERQVAANNLDFSLFYFASAKSDGAADKYKLLLEGAKFADQHGFAAIWTPERHFHAFGGLYPNPSVTSAAIAAVTDRIQIRAGSLVLPLHDPIRVAEEWSVVDNLSHGRVGVAFASGWHANDFVLAPENYRDRKAIMGRQMETIQKLWQGESISLPGGAGNEVKVNLYPRPIQDKLPTWITTGGNPETFQLAGEMGANILTHLLGQTIAELAEKIAIYRTARQQSGWEPSAGRVTLMLHAFVAEDLETVRSKVRQPFCNYLKTSIGLLRNLATSMGQDIDSKDFTDAEMEAILNSAFNRYFQTSALFGTPSTCLELTEQLKAIRVDELACLIDFGVDFDATMASLHYLDIVRQKSNPPTTNTEPEDYSIPAQIARHGVTHLQCTPAMARMLTLNPESRLALGSLQKLMLGGEALPVMLAQELSQIVSGEIRNLYGPTETTVWSTTQSVNEFGNSILIGRPIANTEIYILSDRLQPLPIGVPGELYIGGAGVVPGYLHRPDLTAERFIPHPFSDQPGTRLYRTGDRARYLPDGTIEFLGRIDYQVKIRGFRIELGEIETALCQHPAVREAVAIAQEHELEDKRLVAYIVPNPGQTPSSSELSRFLKEKLPEYMVPGVFVWLDHLPLTPNGKIDRLALLRLEKPQPQMAVAYVAPQTQLEQTISTIWQAVLGLQKVGIYDNFFDLGGHSLLVAQVHSKLQQLFDRQIPLIAMFKHPNISSLAEYLNQDVSEFSAWQTSQTRAQTRKQLRQQQRQLRQRSSDTYTNSP